jgi:hypothetical protein
MFWYIKFSFGRETDRHVLRVFQNRGLRRIFGPKKVKVEP